MSYGERARLELALLVALGCTFLLLDEPITTSTSPPGAFRAALAKYTGTCVLLSMIAIFIEQFATATWIVEDGRIRAL